MRGCRETDDFLKYPVSIHQVNERQKDHQWHKMRDDDVTKPLPARRSVNDSGFDRILAYCLQTRIKYNKGKRGHMPDAVDVHHQLDGPGLCEHRYVAVQPPFQARSQDTNAITRSQKAKSESERASPYPAKVPTDKDTVTTPTVTIMEFAKLRVKPRSIHTAS